jgi:two-component system chemotaxis response regulator CheB
VIKVLVVDDSALVRKLFGRVLAGDPEFEVAFARDGLEALGLLKDFQPDVVTLDIYMPRMDGLACLDRIMLERPCPVLMVSSTTTEGAEAAIEALRLGAVDCVSKPGGAVSLQMDAFAPQLIAKIHAAAQVKLKSSARLRERIQYRLGGHPVARNPRAAQGTLGAGIREGRSGVVLVGSSTGGPPALESLLTPLPALFPWPIVIAQHMPASFTGALARRLNNLCAMTVLEIAQPMLLEPGHAYIARGDGDVVLSRQPVGITASPVPSGDCLWHPSTDRLVRSAMEQLPAARLIGILLTGMGNDGAEAMTGLHTSGGTTIAEAEDSAVVWGMPGELVKAGGADWILSVQHIAERLTKLVHHRAADPKSS